MLINDFFTIKEAIDTEKGKVYRIAFNAAHPIFQVHFAGNPVVPGACIAQMIKELAANHFAVPLFTETVKNMKFLKVINPEVNTQLSVQMTYTLQEEDKYTVAAILNDGDTVFSKATFVLKPLRSNP